MATGETLPATADLTVSAGHTYSRLGEMHEALHDLQAAYQDHDPLFLSVGSDPVLAPLHNELAYRKLLAAAGLPQPA